MTAGAGCAWTATSNASWITINSGSSGTGNGSVGYTVSYTLTWLVLFLTLAVSRFLMRRRQGE